jgi:hypothetical protein
MDIEEIAPCMADTGGMQCRRNGRRRGKWHLPEMEEENRHAMPD